MQEAGGPGGHPGGGGGEKIVTLSHMPQVSHSGMVKHAGPTPTASAFASHQSAHPRPHMSHISHCGMVMHVEPLEEIDLADEKQLTGDAITR